MDPLAALSLSALPPGTGYVVLVALGAAVVYVVECAVWPFGKCPRCSGSGRRYSPDGVHWRDCRRCRGLGKRLRIGRRVWNRARALRRDATR